MIDGTKDNDTLCNNILPSSGSAHSTNRVYKLGIVCKRINSIYSALVHGQGGRLRVHIIGDCCLRRWN